MKQTLTALLILILVNSFGQEVKGVKADTSLILMFNYVVVTTESSSSLRIMENGEMIIDGDTMDCIRTLIKIINSKDSVIMAKERLTSSYMDFTNELPNYYRTTKGNCKWPILYSELKNNGYIFKNLKTKQPCQ